MYTHRFYFSNISIFSKDLAGPKEDPKERRKSSFYLSGLLVHRDISIWDEWVRLGSANYQDLGNSPARSFRYISCLLLPFLAALHRCRWRWERLLYNDDDDDKDEVNGICCCQMMSHVNLIYQMFMSLYHYCLAIIRFKHVLSRKKTFL